MIHISTDQLYDNKKNVKNTEKTKVSINNQYSKDKYKAEKIALKFPVLVKPYGELTSEISNADVLIVATSSSNPTITKDLIFNSKNLLILDSLK